MSKTHYQNGHDCSNSNRDLGAKKSRLVQKALVLPSRAKVDCCYWTQWRNRWETFLLGSQRHPILDRNSFCCMLWKTIKRQPHPAASPRMNPFSVFSPEHTASCWKPSKIRRSDLTSYLNFRSTSWSGHPGRTLLKRKSKLQVVVWPEKERIKPTDSHILRDKCCYKIITLLKTT